MFSTRLWLILLPVAIGVTGGCVIDLGVGRRRAPTATEIVAPLPRRVPADGSTIAEIDAVGLLLSESRKREAYVDLARRPDLSAEAQVRLVAAARDRLLSPSAKEEVILSLIGNPEFCGESKAMILNNLRMFLTDSAKARVLAAIRNRD